MSAAVAFPSPAYAEGTWTPVLTFATAGDLSVAYTTQLGYYKRIGNLVFATFSLTTSTFTHTTASGNLQVTGLPIQSANISGLGPSNAVGFSGVTKVGFTQMVATLGAASSTITFGMSGSAVALTNATAADMPTAGTVILRGTAIYHA